MEGGAGVRTETFWVNIVLILNQEEEKKEKELPLSVMAEQVILISSPDEDNLKSLKKYTNQLHNVIWK